MNPKNIILNVIFSISVLYGNVQYCGAQIVLGTNDLPVAGKLQITVKVNPLQGADLLPGMAGPNVKWDFRDINPCCGTREASADTIVWGDHNATGSPGFFPLSNIAMRDQCTTYHSHDTHQDEIQCFFNHYIENSSGLWRYGMEKPDNFIFDSNWNIFPLLGYGDSLKTTAEFHVPISYDSIRVYHIFSKAVADAWGVISTPDTTADAIRIYTTETVYDTLYVSGMLKKSNVYQGNYYYRWYTKNLGFPVMEIAKGMQFQQPPFSQRVQYSYHKSNTTSVSQIEVSEKIRVFPNPFSSTIDLDFGKNFNNASFILFDATGKTVMKKANVFSGSRIQAGGLTPGIYFYEIINPQKEIFRGKLLKNNN